MLKGFATTIIILLVNQLYAQQLINSSHYFFKPAIYNPAFVSKSTNMNAMLLHHNQWVGFDGSPKAGIFAIDARLKEKKIGLGAIIEMDRRGISQRTGANLMYSYRVVLAKNNFLSLGLSFGMYSHRFNYSNVVMQDADDPNLANGSQSSFAINTGAGVAFVNKKIEAGFSIPQLISSKAKLKTLDGSSFFYKESLHYVNYLRYNYRLSKTRFMYLSPFYLLRVTPNAPLYYDAGLLFDYKYKFWAGLVYKNKTAISLNAGLCLYKRVSVGYAFDYTLGNLATYAGNTHEVMLNYTFGKIQVETNSLVYDSLITEKPDLNTLLVKKILLKADTVLENPKSSKSDCILLIAKLNEFTASFEEDPKMQRILTRYNDKLTERMRQIDDMHIVFKGQIVLPEDKKNKQKPDYSDAIIRLYEKDTDRELGTYTAKPKNGKFLIPVKPGDKCYIQVEKAGFQIYKKDLKTTEKHKSYEVELIVKLKKIKKIPSK